MIVRPTATAVPFSVCTCAGPAAGGGAVADVEPPRLVVGRVRGRGQLAVAVLPGEPRLAVVLLRRRGPEIVDGDRHDPVRDLELGQDRLLDRQQPLVLGRRFAGSTKLNISTLSNWWTRKIPRVSLPAAPASRRKQRREAGVAQRQLGLGEDLVAVQRRERDLRGADEIQVVVGQAVDLLLGVGQERRSRTAPLAHEHGRDHRLEPSADAASRARSGRARARPSPGRRAGRQTASLTAARRAPCRSDRRRARGGRVPVAPASPTSCRTVSSSGASSAGRFGSDASSRVALGLNRRFLIAERAAASRQRRQLLALLGGRRALFDPCSRVLLGSELLELGRIARHRSSSSSTRSTAAAAPRHRAARAPRGRRPDRGGSAGCRAHPRP